MLPCFPGAIICAGGEPRHACQTPQNQAGGFFAQADYISIDASHRNATKPLSACLSVLTPTPLQRGPEFLVISYLYRAGISSWWEFVTADRRAVTLAV